MKMFYRIEIYPEPNYSSSSSKSYFWRVASIDKDNPDFKYCTIIAGWSETPEKAFEEASYFYNECKKVKV